MKERPALMLINHSGLQVILFFFSKLEWVQRFLYTNVTFSDLTLARLGPTGQEEGERSPILPSLGKAGGRVTFGLGLEGRAAWDGGKE